MMEVRAAALEDLDGLAGLFDAYRQFYQQAPDLQRAREFLAERLENAESWIFLAVHKGQPAGFVQLYPSFSSVQTRRTLVLNDLFVSDGARGQGVGEALMERAESFAREMSAAQLTLETGRDNHPAQALYEKRGWKKVQECYFYNLGLKALLLFALIFCVGPAAAGTQSWSGLGIRPFLHRNSTENYRPTLVQLDFGKLR